MTKYISIFVILVLSAFSISAMASHSVSGYYRQDGAYVQPHMSMDPGEARSSGYSYHNNEIVPYHEYGDQRDDGYGMSSSNEY